MHVIDEFLREIRFSVRRLRRRPGFSLVAIATLALGLGASTAIFAVVNAVLLRPLPYDNPDELITIESTRNEDAISLAYLDLQDFASKSQSFESVAGFTGNSVTVGGIGGAERVRTQMVTASLLPMLGVRPLHGRVMLPEEDAVGAPRVAVIGHDLWQRRFAGERDAIGESLMLDGVPHTIIGVMPPGFDFPGGMVYGAAEIWTSLTNGLNPLDREDRDSHPGIVGLARMRDGITVDAAREDLSRVAADINTRRPANQPPLGVRATEALDSIVGSTRGYLVVLLAAVGLMLLIACANVANLMLVQATGRVSEFAVRLAIGANRWRLAFQVMMESTVLAAIGGAVGLTLAIWITRATAALLTEIPRAQALAIDARVIAFAGALILMTSIIAGAAPLWLVGTRFASALRERASTGKGKLRNSIAAIECGLALVLTVGACLLLRSFAALQQVPPGIDATGVITFEVDAPESRYPQPSDLIAFHETLAEQFAAIPGVTNVGAITTLPFSGSGAQSGMRLIDRPDVDGLRTDIASVTPEYFAAMGVQLVRGRLFNAGDRESSEPVAVIDERFAATAWPGQDPIGKQIQGAGPGVRSVIGVVKHVKNYGVNAESREEAYFPFAQRPRGRLHYTVRTESGDPLVLTNALRNTLATLDAEVPLYRPRRMTDVMSSTIAIPRLNTTVLTVFGGLAILLAAIGIHGVMTYSVSLRRREIGVRLAMGATPPQMRRMVLGETLKVAGTGAIGGIVLTFWLVRLLQNQMLGVATLDVPAFAIATSVLLAIALVAGAFAARRAGAISPQESLRE